MKISFVLPAWKARFLKEAISSIVSQTSQDWELVVVDDCSPEDIKSVVDQFEDKRISYHRNSTNLGKNNLVEQWNHSIGFAKGEWIVMAADDDIYAPTFCEELLTLAQKYPAVEIMRSRVSIIDQNGQARWSDRSFPEHMSCYEYLNNWLEGKVFTCVGNFAFKKKALRQAGGFMDFPHAFCSDQATPLILAQNGIAHTGEPLFKFRQSDSHLSGDRTLLKDKLTAMMEFYKWLEGFEYPAPSSKRDIKLYSIKNKNYLHKKCIYDCFNHTILLVPLKELPSCLRMCRVANPWEKSKMLARWIKHHLCGEF